MKRKAWDLLLALAMQAVACGALAQGAYVAGGAGQSRWNFDCGPNGCDRSTTAWRLAAGYRFNRIVAVEAFYYDFGRARSSTASLDGTFGASASGAEVLAGWQFGEFEVAGKIGAASVRSDFRPAATSFDVAQRARHAELIGGLMSAYRFTPNMAARLDVDIVTAALDSNGVYYSRGSDIVTVIAGVMIRF
jgi:hypothetical protein